MNKILKSFLLSMLGLLATIILLFLKVNIMRIQEIINRQLLVEKVHDFALSPDGEYIAFCNAEGLKKLSLKNGRQEWLLRSHSQSSRCQMRSIKWSPDMTRIAFVKDFSPGHSELNVLETTTKRLRVIDRALSFAGVSWSPDGRQLAWIKEERKPAWQNRLVVGVLQKDKVQFRVLYEDRMIYSIRWTPDGQFLLFVADVRPHPTAGNLSAIGVIRLDGTNLKWLYPLGHFPMHQYFSIPYSGWDISPNGTTVAFGFGDFLWLYSIKKPEALPVKIRLIGRALEICWSPDGKGLLYTVSESKAPIAPGSAKTSPPHSLYWVDKEGRKNQFILQEEKGICNLQWLKGCDIFYISGGILYKVTLRI